MTDIFFEIPFYKRITSHHGWKCTDSKKTQYQISRAFFLLKTHQKAGPAKIGRKLSIFGAPRGVGQDRLRSIELETEVFKQVESIKKSIIETGVVSNISSSLLNNFGDGKIFQIGGKIDSSISTTIKNTFSDEFRVTNATRERKIIKYEFKDTVQADVEDLLCGVAGYQKCTADLYLIKIDFLNISYEKSIFGLRKKIKKNPFPKDSENDPESHPNVIKIGSYLKSFEYWDLIPECSWVIKDADYSPEVENDSEVTVFKKRKHKRQTILVIPTASNPISDFQCCISL